MREDGSTPGDGTGKAEAPRTARNVRSAEPSAAVRVAPRTAGNKSTDAPMTTALTASAAPDPAIGTPVPSPRHMPVAVLSHLVKAMTHLPPAPDPQSPLQAPTIVAMLSALRDETQKNALRRAATTPVPQLNSLPIDPSPNVLVIGVDGTNLSRILENPANANFFGLMQTGTTAAASIAGHTTISNPSWTSILTGVWGETTGVINNVFTPWTYDKWPTVFNLLETQNPAIRTTAIADWDVIAGIAGAGSAAADDIVYVNQIAGDTNWSLTDDAVGDATEAAIAAADPGVPNFVFSYFVGVDENGHMYGGASQQYADAIGNVDRNLGEILEEVNAWESATGEQWTILMVTDHGHRPEKGIGHGFQTPRETSTFVIANNPGIFASGAINLQYSIVDVTPTVVTLFGGTPPDYSEGVSLTDLDGSDVFPIDDDAALRGALQDAIAMYGYPDIGTTLALDTRTIFTSVPYFVYQFTTSATAQLQALAGEDIPLLSPLAALAVVPVKIFGDTVYVATNAVAQVVARLTGVTGASLFPLLPPPPPVVEAPDSGSDATALCTANAQLGCSSTTVAV